MPIENVIATAERQAGRNAGTAREGSPAARDGATYWRKKPIPVLAWQLTKKNWQAIHIWAPDIFHFIGNRTGDGDDDLDCLGLRVKTLEGWLFAEIGDWIVRGVKGEFYPVKPDIFAETYEPVPCEQSEPAEGGTQSSEDSP